MEAAGEKERGKLPPRLTVLFVKLITEGTMFFYNIEQVERPVKEKGIGTDINKMEVTVNRRVRKIACT
jgi:hypothetical protein